ncbi:MAG: hypothetical protein OKBPIBMD_02048 [Chlorobi bacterium]|nr:hypothetical protein [Chlorobiota bacterium]
MSEHLVWTQTNRSSPCNPCTRIASNYRQVPSPGQNAILPLPADEPTVKAIKAASRTQHPNTDHPDSGSKARRTTGSYMAVSNHARRPENLRDHLIGAGHACRSRYERHWSSQLQNHETLSITDQSQRDAMERVCGGGE